MELAWDAMDGGKTRDRVMIWCVGLGSLVRRDIWSE